MRIIILLLLAFGIPFFASGQTDERVTTIDFVQVLNDNIDEATYYYQNNWKVLREMAIAKGYIHSYQLLATPPSESEPFHLMLITTYQDAGQFEKSEEHFAELIKAKGALQLMNDKMPGEFRKVLFSKEEVRHLD